MGIKGVSDDEAADVKRNSQRLMLGGKAAKLKPTEKKRPSPYDFFCQSLGLIGLHASKLLIKDKLICSKITPPQYYAATQDNSPSPMAGCKTK